MNDSIPSKNASCYLNSSFLVPAILLLAAFLRMLYIGNHSLWLDELFSLKFASYGFSELLREVAGFDNHPPVYYLLLHFWIQIFGDSELSLRTPSAIFSVLGVYFTFKVGELLFNRRVALIAALLLALSGFSIHYAQEARMYSLLALTSVLSVYFFLKLQKQQTPRNLFYYVASTTLLVYSHLYGIFVVVAENIYVLVILYRFGDRVSVTPLKKWLSAQGMIFLLSLPWFAILINRILNITREGFWVEVPTGASVVKTFATFSGTSSGLAIWLALLILGSLSVFLVKVKSIPEEERHVFLLLLLLFTPIFLPYLVSQFTTPIYIIRSTIAGQFAFFLLVANGIVHIRWRYLRNAALVLLLAMSLKVLLASNYIHHNAAQLREAVEYLSQEVNGDDKVILCSHSHLNWPLKYYADKAEIAEDRLVVDSGKVSGLDARRLWLVRKTDLPGQCDDFPQAVADRYVQTDKHSATFRNLELTVFEAR